ncbi:MAG: DUF3105 domain-containing protein, partial [Patescibacteria group bacterium]|nr:DUF3105 domain-containing protein [Patescibacteria group bacterium]
GADDRREDAPAQSGGADDRREDAPAQSGGADDRREDAPAQSGGADEGVPATENVKTGAQLREGCADAVTRMTEMARDEFDSWKVVVVPGPNLDTRFALTAWTRLDKFEDFDEERVRRFIKAYRNKGPEATAE